MQRCCSLYIIEQDIDKVITLKKKKVTSPDLHTACQQLGGFYNGHILDILIHKMIY